MPIAQSRAPIETILKKVGTTRIVIIDEALEGIVAFTLAGRLVRLCIAVPGDATDQRRWTIGLVVKAKIEAVAQGITTVEQRWLARVVPPDGSTVDDWVEPQLCVAYDQGWMPTEPLMFEGFR